MKFRAQAVFFDGILFLLVVIFSISIVFVALNSYTTPQDHAINSAYFMNYMQSVSKSLYYIDARTMAADGATSFGGGGPVEGYCDDLKGARYCRNGALGVDKYPMECNDLEVYPPLITVMDLLKKDVSDPPRAPVESRLNDYFGASKQMGKTALRCAMKEIMKPYTFSGYRYLAEVTHIGSDVGDVEGPIYPYTRVLTTSPPTDFPYRDYASDYMYSDDFDRLPVDTGQNQFGCEKVDSRQLVAVRSPFVILVGKGVGQVPRDADSSGFEKKQLAFRLCAWPANGTTG